MASERLEPGAERLNDAATEAHGSQERTLKEIFTDHNCLFHLCKMETFFCLPDLQQVHTTGPTHTGLGVGTLGRRKLSANQVAPGRTSSGRGREIVVHTAAFALESCCPVKDSDK